MRSSGFDTVCSEFSHAFSDRDLGRSVTEMSCVSQIIDFSDVLEQRTHAQCDRDWALRKHLELEMAFFGTLIETTEKCFFFRTGVVEHHDLRGATQIQSLAPIWRFGEWDWRRLR